MDMFGEINLTGLASVILFYLLILGVTSSSMMMMMMMMMTMMMMMMTMREIFICKSELKVGMWAAQKKSDVEGISEEVQNTKLQSNQKKMNYL